MSKILQISEEIEKHLVNIFDHALKAGGMAILGSIDKVRSCISCIASEIPGSPADPVSAPQPPNPPVSQP